MRQVIVMGQEMEFGLGGGDPLLDGRDISLVDPTVRASDVDALFREHAPRLVQLAAAITLDRWLAEEVVQDAFTNLHANAAAVNNPTGYLQRAVVNRSISVIRRRKVAARHPDPVAQPTITAEIDETWDLVTQLPVRERAVVVLRYWLDLSERDISDQLGWPRGTVKSTLNRALSRLRRQLP